MSYDTVASSAGHVASVCHLTLQCHPQCNVQTSNSALSADPSALYRGV